MKKDVSEWQTLSVSVEEFQYAAMTEPTAHSQVLWKSDLSGNIFLSFLSKHLVVQKDR